MRQRLTRHDPAGVTPGRAFTKPKTHTDMERDWNKLLTDLRTLGRITAYTWRHYGYIVSWALVAVCLCIQLCINSRDTAERQYRRTLKAQADYITVLERALGQEYITDVMAETDTYQAYERATH